MDQQATANAEAATQAAIRLNELLGPLEDALPPPRDEPAFPTVFIIGAPRSGTTLTSQLLASRGGFAYVTNFLARFWRAPQLGILLEQALGLRPGAYASEFRSEWGRTRGWLEPHEFGYFWDRWFNQGQSSNKLSIDELSQVDAATLKQVVAGIEAGYVMPLVFSNNTWCSFQVEFLAGLFPRALFVFCERDPLFVAQSVLLGRRRLHGDSQTWWSVRPPGHEQVRNLPWWDQISWQVHATLSEIEDGLSQVPELRKLRLPYQELCKAPAASAELIAERVNDLGGELPATAALPDRFEPTDVRRIESEDFERLERSIQRYFASAQEQQETQEHGC